MRLLLKGSKAIWMSGMIGLLAAVCGCSADKGAQTEGKSTPAQPQAVQQEPVTLTFYAKLGITDEEFAQYFVQPLKAKYPHVTLNRVKNEKGTTPAELVASGQTPDIIWEGLTNMNALIDLNWPSNLDPLVKKHSFDLSRIDPTVVSFIRTFSEKGELLYLPFRRYPFVLHWNKGIFDKFGAAYPQNGMTWDDTVELAKKVSRSDAGIDYRGLSGGVNINRIQTQLSLQFIDPKTNKSVLLANELWADLFRMYYKIYNIPGNYPNGAKFNDGVASFVTNRVLAMFPHLSLLGDGNFKKAVNDGLEWGISTYPVWNGKPNIGPGVISDGFIIPNNTKTADLAFEMIAYLLTDEAQTAAAKYGNPTALLNPNVRKHIYEDNPLVKGRDLSPLYALQSAQPYVTTPYDNTANIQIILKKLEPYYTNQIDLNTALREADEEINKMVQEELAKKK